MLVYFAVDVWMKSEKRQTLHAPLFLDVLSPYFWAVIIMQQSQYW